jgi:hypothetical protein
MTIPVCVIVASASPPRARAMPKSVTFVWPVFVIMML